MASTPENPHQTTLLYLSLPIGNTHGKEKATQSRRRPEKPKILSGEEPRQAPTDGNLIRPPLKQDELLPRQIDASLARLGPQKQDSETYHLLLNPDGTLKDITHTLLKADRNMVGAYRSVAYHKPLKRMYCIYLTTDTPFKPEKGSSKRRHVETLMTATDLLAEKLDAKTITMKTWMWAAYPRLMQRYGYEPVNRQRHQTLVERYQRYRDANRRKTPDADGNETARAPDRTPLRMDRDETV